MLEYIINKKSFRLNIFDELDYNSAYFIGYLAGDAAFSRKTHKKHAKLTISSINEQIIIWIKNNFCPDSTYRSIIPVNKKRNIVTKNLSYILPLSSKFSPIFNKYGILDIKENRKCINISKKLFREYLKGIIDSDGHFSSGRRKDRNRIWCNFGITHQSLQLLKTIQKYLSEELEISSYINPRNNEKCMDLKISKISDIIKLINWLNLENNCPFDKYYQTDKILNLIKSDAT